MDAAKAIAALAANPGLDREGFFKKAWKNPPLPIVLIGTTSGTGSEVSPTSVLTVDGVKKVCFRAGALRVSCHREPGVYRYNVL